MTAHLLDNLTKALPWRRIRLVGTAGGNRIAAAAAVAGAAVLMSTAAPAPAHAYEYSHGGTTGLSSTASVGKCKQTSYRTLVVSSEPPAVMGANLTSRKDYTWVRYRAFLVNAGSGRAVEQTGWSAWLKAADNAVSTWTGTTSMSGDLAGNYVLDYRIEWWNSSRQLGWEAHRVNPYRFYNEYNVGPIGPFSSCARIR